MIKLKLTTKDCDCNINSIISEMKNSFAIMIDSICHHFGDYSSPKCKLIVSVGIITDNDKKEV